MPVLFLFLHGYILTTDVDGSHADQNNVTIAYIKGHDKVYLQNYYCFC